MELNRTTVRITFLSTLSLRRATTYLSILFLEIFYFYPHSPCGERHHAVEDKIKTKIISIHTLLAESDSCTTAPKPYQLNFYPHSPCGERLFSCYLDNIEIIISIHTLLAESDYQSKVAISSAKKFLSTLSLRRATHFSAGGASC